MDRAGVESVCMSMPGARLDFPFGPDPGVYKVKGKMFALVPQSGDASISLKCDPTYGTILRQSYAAIQPGYHLNKVHWISIDLDGDVPDDEVRDLIEQSYALVVRGLTRVQRAALERGEYE